MTVKQLKEAIKDAPDDMDVFIEKTNDEHQLTLLEKAVVMEVQFSDGKLKAHDDSVVLSDEL